MMFCFTSFSPILDIASNDFSDDVFEGEFTLGSHESKYMSKAAFPM